MWMGEKNVHIQDRNGDGKEKELKRNREAMRQMTNKQHPQGAQGLAGELEHKRWAQMQQQGHFILMGNGQANNWCMERQISGENVVKLEL